MASEHELILDSILDAFDLQLLAPNRPSKDLFDDLVGTSLYGGMGCLRQGIILADTGMSFKGALDGQEDTGFVEFLQTAVAFADKKLSAMQRVNAVHVQLIKRHIHYLNSVVRVLSQPLHLVA